MLRWFERFATLIVVLLTIGVLLACWMPAYVGVPDSDGHFRQRWVKSHRR